MYKPLLAELFLDNAESDRNAINLYVSQPSPLEEKNLGKVFVILEVDDPPNFTAELIERINSTFSDSFYHSADFELEAAFERALQKVNKVVRDIVAEHGEDWIYHIHGIVGIVHETDVHFSYVGSMEAFLIQGEEIIDVIQTKDTDIKPLKLFTNIISGQCPEKCAMLFSTSNLLDYLSLEKIRRVVKEQSPDNAVAQFESILTENTALSNIAGLLVSAEKVSKPTVPALNQEDELERTEFSDSEDSMEKLISQEQRTGDLLAPSIWPTIKKRMQSFTGSKPGANPNNETQRSSLNYARSQNKFFMILLIIGNFLKSVGIQIFVGLVYVGKQVVRLFRSKDSISSKVGSSVNGATNWFTRLSVPRKVFLFLFALVLIIFIGSLFFKNRSVEKAEVSQNYEDTLNDVENKLGEVQSKKIMEDEGGARLLVVAADDLLQSVPRDEKEYTDRINSLQSQIDDYNNSFNKVTVLNDVPEVGNFASISDDVDTNSITKIGDNIFGFDGNNNAIYRINLAGNQVSEIVSSTGENYQSVENDSAATTLVLLNDDTFVQFNPVLEKTSAVTVADLPDNATLTDFDIFGSRIYSLDTANQQIYKQQKSGDNYGQPTDWLTEEIDLSNAMSFDIDSSVYVLMNTGNILKLDGGAQSDFQIEEFGPSLEGSIKIVKNVDSSSFFILNPSTQRIVILNEDGTLDRQLSSSQFDNLRDMTVDEANGKIYLLANNKVLSIDL